ncbi:hypothetical protein [Myroides sp. NP-2]|uniref:hypothetical protein n=1 Tax=Myroides sp. NP-2 TaxID=2759945 RepID=UPI0021068DB4|nr:hypothetical protein [Myroides sp. NP-2]
MENTISNTLFRFVSLRSVQIPDAEHLLQRYVQIEKDLVGQGVFYEAIQKRPVDATKYETMLKAAASFKEVIPTTKALQEEFAGIQPFSTWLAQNKATATPEEISKKAEGIKAIDTKQQGKLWNNVFYQATVQDNLVLNDQMIEILKANALLEQLKLKATNDAVYEKATASFVLPAELFNEEMIEDDKVQPKVATEKPKIVLPNRLMTKNINISKAKLQEEQLTILQQDLTVLAEEYQKEYQKAYTTALEAYEKEVTPIFENHYKELEVARKNYCSTVPMDKREYNPHDPCQQPPYVPMPVVPKFNFKFKEELSEKELQEKLDPISYQTLLQSIGYQEKPMKINGRNLKTEEATPQRLLDTVGSYANLNTYVQANVQNNQALLTGNIEAYQPIKSIGGVLFPINNEIISNVLEYNACGTLTNLQRMATITIKLPDSSWQIATITVSIAKETLKESYVLDTSAVERNGNEVTLHNVEGYSAATMLDRTPSTMALDFQFTNGCVKRMPALDIAARVCYRGELEGICGTSVIAPVPTYPKKFGVRLLGIADYKKVEQTVHCYIEGEVSNIENIMAREYREKSTRRLRRTEETTTETTEQEIEAFTDTVTTDRFEMQSEIDSLLQKNKSTNAYVNTGYSYGQFHIEGGVAQASNTAQAESIRRSVTEAKELTYQAQDRVVNRIKSERMQKMMEEFEENNKHGFDNRKGDKHVVGVYRWVDKLYKNQVYNYGKRMMFEFMIPEPARLHLLAMQDEQESTTLTIKQPIDPRTHSNNAIATADQITEANALYWAAQYNAEIPVKPGDSITIGKGFSAVSEKEISRIEVFTINENLEIPDGYQAHHASVSISATDNGSPEEGKGMLVNVGNGSFMDRTKFAFLNTSGSFSVSNFVGEIPVSINGGNYFAGAVNVSVSCKLTKEAYKKWQQECFQAIIEAYDLAAKAYNDKLAAEQNKAVEIKHTNPGFYRQIENIVLRKNCIAYLTRFNDMGKNFTSGKTIADFAVQQNKELEAYASLAKFMEQAFEWEAISYNFYPFYWGSKGHWVDLYTYDESDDPIFRSFMQSGMARVVATVRPGFEEAVQLYMSTGKIWNGGEIPVIGDELYLSLIDEVRQAETVKEGKAWITRIPTSLTILQAKSAGLEVEKALPCNCDDTADFEDPSQVPCSDAFVLNDNLIGGDTGAEPEPVN